MVDSVSFSTHDYDGEPSGFQINVTDITAANHDATLALITTLRTATVALMKDGGIEKVALNEILWNTPVPVTLPDAQREHKYQVVVVEATTGRKYASVQLPIANFTDYLLNGSPYIVKAGVVTGDDTGGQISDWVAAFEAVAKSPNNNALSVWDMYQVGRNI